MFKKIKNWLSPKKNDAIIDKDGFVNYNNCAIKMCEILIEFCDNGIKASEEFIKKLDKIKR